MLLRWSALLGGALALSPSYVRADELATLETDQVGVALDSDPGADDFSIVLKGKGDEPLPRPEVFPIDGPPRLVIDIPKLTSKSSQTVAVDHARVSAVRVGVHPNKTRIVLDLSADSVAPRFAVRKLGGGEGFGIAVSFSGALPVGDDGTNSAAEAVEPPVHDTPKAKAPKGEQKQEKIQDDEIASLFEEELKKSAAAKKAAAKAEEKKAVGGLERDGGAHAAEHVTAPVKEAGTLADKGSGKKAAVAAPDEPSFDEDPSEIAFPDEPAEEPVKAAKKGAEPAVDEEVIKETVDPGALSGGGSETASGNVVKGIFYQMTSGAKVPAVVFDVEGLSSYSLKKKKPDLFELTLDNVKLAGKHLTLPQFPPDAFFGFNVIVAKEEGKNVAVKIYIEEGVKLFPFIAKKQLWLKANK